MLQRSDEWFAARVGKLTASRIAEALATVKSGESAGRRNCRAQLVAERLTGLSQSADLSNNKAVQHGVEHEDQARSMYEFVTSNTVMECGFIDHPEIQMAGASPDGLIAEHGLIEIKCPNTSTHIQYLIDNKVPSNYIPQMTWQLSCTDRKWVDFVSFDQRLDSDNQLFVIRFEPTQQEIDRVNQQAIEFLDEVEQLTLLLKNRVKVSA